MKKTTLALLIGLASTVALAGQVIHVVKPGEKDFNFSWMLNQQIKSVDIQTHSVGTTTIYIAVSSPAFGVTVDPISVVCGNQPAVTVNPGGSADVCQLVGTPANPNNDVHWTDVGTNGSNGVYTIN